MVQHELTDYGNTLQTVGDDLVDSGGARQESVVSYAV